MKSCSNFEFEKNALALNSIQSEVCKNCKLFMGKFDVKESFFSFQKNEQPKGRIESH